MNLTEMIDETGLNDSELQALAAKGGFKLSHATVWTYRAGNMRGIAGYLPRPGTLEALAYVLNRSEMEVLTGIMESQGRTPDGMSGHVRQAEQRLEAGQPPKRRGRRGNR